MSTKTEIQSRIDAAAKRLIELYLVHKKQDARVAAIESDIASLKADLAKCDCADGIEQEKCWHSVNNDGGVADVIGKTKQEAADYSSLGHPAYMPECRQVTAEDAQIAFDKMFKGSYSDSARELHKLGFRIKVTP